MILETTFETPTGSVRVIDFMSRREGASDLVRIVKGLRGKVAMHTELIVRFEYRLRGALGVAPARWTARDHRGAGQAPACRGHAAARRGFPDRRKIRGRGGRRNRLHADLVAILSCRAGSPFHRRSFGDGGIVLERMVGALPSAVPNGRTR